MCQETTKRNPQYAGPKGPMGQRFAEPEIAPLPPEHPGVKAPLSGKYDAHSSLFAKKTSSTFFPIHHSICLGG